MSRLRIFHFLWVVLAALGCQIFGFSTEKLTFPLGQTATATFTASPSATITLTSTSTVTPSPTFTSTPTNTPTPSPTPFAGFIDLRAIVQKEEGGDYLLFDSEGNELRNLTGGLEGTVYDWELSPDTRHMVVILEFPKPQPYQFWLVELNGGEPRLLFDLVCQDPWIYWSPDNTHFLAIVHSAMSTKEWLYHLASVAGGEPLLFQTVYYTRYDIEWSHDGSQIAFLCDNSHVCLLDTASGELTDTGFKAGGDLSYTEDDQWLLWDSFQYWYSLNVITKMQIFAWRIGDADFQQVATAAWLDSPTYPVWSKDGQYIYYTSIEAGVPYLMKIGVGGSGPESLYRFDQRVRLTSLSPDGKWLALRNIILVREGSFRYIRADKIGIIPVDGGAPVWVPVDAGSTHSSFWTPDGKYYVIRDMGKYAFLEVETGTYSTPGWMDWVAGYYYFAVIWVD